MSDAPSIDTPLERFWRSASCLHVAGDGQMSFPSETIPPGRLLMPGSFNPIHHGHWQLARVAEEMCGEPIAFEMSVSNVDKPDLTPAEIRRRVAQFQWQASVWLTRAPLFAEKARQFPGATFVIGADTALRIVSPRYYQDDGERMQAALRAIADLECRFLVACRVDARGECIGGAELPIPAAFRQLFEEIAPSRFRCDISSSDLRGRHQDFEAAHVKRETDSAEGR